MKHAYQSFSRDDGTRMLEIEAALTVAGNSWSVGLHGATFGETGAGYSGGIDLGLTW